MSTRRLHALARVAGRAAGETDTENAGRPRAHVELDVHVLGDAAMDREAWVRTSIRRSQQADASELVERAAARASSYPSARLDGRPRWPRTTAQQLGALGEQRALEHYERLGFRLLERNWRTARRRDRPRRSATAT